MNASHTASDQSGGRPGNEAARVGMLALFQDQLTLMVRLQLISCPDPRPQRRSDRVGPPLRNRLDCNIACHEC